MALTLEQMYEMQKQLDARIIREKGLEGQDLLPNTVLALQVEICELANEWRGFKHWSNDREPRYEKRSIAFLDKEDGTGEAFEYVTYPLLEEYVDCLHFILSIGLQIGADEWDLSNLEPFIPYGSEAREDVTEHFIDVISYVSGLRNIKESDDEYDQYRWTIEIFLGLGIVLGFDWEKISDAYAAKNAVNHERQSNGY